MNKTYTRSLMVLFLLILLATLTIFIRDAKFNFPSEFILKIRLNKIFACIMAAFSIGFATYILQKITRNNIVDISFFGIASFNIMIISIIYYYLFNIVDKDFLFRIIVPFISLGVSILVTSFILLFTLRKNSVNKRAIVLVGIFLNYVFMAIGYVFLKRLPPIQASAVMDMLLGNIREGYSIYMTVGIASLLTLSVIWYISLHKKIQILNTSIKLSQKLGINQKIMYWQIIFIVGINAAISFSLIGSVSFLGIISANLAMQFIGNKKMSALISGFIAAIICSIAYLLFNLIGGLYYPVGLTATIMSIPYFIYRIVKG